MEHQLLQTVIAGVPQNQDGVRTACLTEHHALLPDGHREIGDACIVQGGIDFLQAVAVAVAFQNGYQPAAGMEPGLNVLNIVPQGSEFHNCLRALRQLAQIRHFSFLEINAIYYSTFSE